MNESSRVRQSRSLFFSLGSFFKRRYFRAVFSSIPDFAAASDSVFYWFNNFISVLTWQSVINPISFHFRSLDHFQTARKPGILIVARREF